MKFTMKDRHDDKQINWGERNVGEKLHNISNAFKERGKKRKRLMICVLKGNTQCDVLLISVKEH